MFRMNDTKINHHWIYLDNDDDVLLMPCLYARYTSRLGLSVEIEYVLSSETNIVEPRFVTKEITEKAQYTRGSQLGIFLEWVEEQEIYCSPIRLHMHTAFPQELLNEYINEHLIENCHKSEAAVNHAVVALQSYYNWLSRFFNNPIKNILVFTSHRALARANNKQGLLVKYLLPATRELIYRQTNTLLQELILRNGGELGLRSKENQGFLLKDFIVNGKKYLGLLSLFYQLEKHPDKEEFEYYLSSLYTKYGRSRTLVIPRYLLEK